ncbi:hypothetical protein SAY87_012350 [Trapa incisa]|uniref:Uncharacterized protein n=1 Tax=Trapa incisa TaxID=236973 RepID=A0AAN7GJX0_9MYRT|nr:hypothetical protein SAY87_012350 [Trapa incisa]
MLEWGDGYYNGDIKIRKTAQAVDFNADELGLQRSEQLRELYKWLSTAESSQLRRPSGALSPEDLSDTEWYYLVCMSFCFHIGQGLPGRTLSTGQSTWHCDLPYADCSIFCRSLLAKVGHVNFTVVCFPFFGGAVELGVTNLVPEDSALIQYAMALLLETPHLRSSTAFHHNVYKTHMIPTCGEDQIVSSTTSADRSFAHRATDELLMVGGTNIADFNDSSLHSEKSSHYISHTSIDLRNAIQHPLDNIGLDVQDDHFHYQSILWDLLKTAKEFLLLPNLEKNKRESCFGEWKYGGLAYYSKQRCGTHQRMLKGILFEVPRMHDQDLTEFPTQSCSKKNGVWKHEADGISMFHVSTERRQYDKINEQLSTLGSMAPSSRKVHVLEHKIQYLKTLKRRLEELECIESGLASREEPTQETSERRHDNHGVNTFMSDEGLRVKKRKACEIDDMKIAMKYDDNLFVSVEDKEVVIVMKCRWKEGLLLEIVNTASNLQLDFHSIQSSMDDGILSLAVKSKMVGSTVLSAQTIRRAMQRFSGRQC